MDYISGFFDCDFGIVKISEGFLWSFFSVSFCPTTAKVENIARMNSDFFICTKYLKLRKMEYSCCPFPVSLKFLQK